MIANMRQVLEKILTNRVVIATLLLIIITKIPGIFLQQIFLRGMMPITIIIIII